MQQTFFLSYSGWKELPATLIYPINATYGIDGGTDTMEFSFYASQDFDLPLDTPIKVQHNNDIRYFVVKDCKFSDMQYVNLTTQQPERLFTISLSEPFELLRGYKVQGCKFAANRYSNKECLERLFYLARFSGIIDIPNPNSMLTNVLEFTSTTLYLAIYEVARTQDCIPYLDFDETYKSWIVKFQPLDGLTSQKYEGSILTNPIIQKQCIGEGIAKKVYVENSNLKIPLFKRQSVVSATAVDNSDTINIYNFGIKLSSNIDNLRSVSIYTNGYTWYFGNNIVIDYVALYETTYFEEKRTIKILSKLKYDNLTTDEKENNDIIYIYYENNIIYMTDLNKLKPNTINVPDEVWENDWDGEAATFALQKVKGSANELVGRIHDIAKPIWQQEYTVYAQVTVTNTIPFLAYNNNDFDDITFYNQNAKAVDPVSMERVLQTYIDNMQSGTLLRSGIFNTYADIPQEGSIIIIDNKNYIVNSLTIVDNVTYYDVTFALVEQHAKRREYLEANTDIQIEDITSNELIPSYNLRPYLIKYSIDDIIEPLTNLDFKQHKGIIFPGNVGQLYEAKMFMYFNKGGEHFGINFRSNVDYVTYSNSISFYATAETNFTWRDAIDSDGNLIPQTYVNGDGEINYCTIELEAPNHDVLVKFDLGDERTKKPIKDKFEIFTITNQYTYKGVNGTIIGNDFIDWLLNATHFDKCWIYIYNEHIGAYSDRPINHVAFAEATVSVNTSAQKIIIDIDNPLIGNYKSIVITDLGGNKVLFVKNYYDERNVVADGITIYYSIEDGLPIQNAVRPYDY